MKCMYIVFALFFLTFFAIGMQCDDNEEQAAQVPSRRRRTRQRERRLRRLESRRRLQMMLTTVVADADASSEATSSRGGLLPIEQEKFEDALNLTRVGQRTDTLPETGIFNNEIPGGGISRNNGNEVNESNRLEESNSDLMTSSNETDPGNETTPSRQSPVQHNAIDDPYHRHRRIRNKNARIFLIQNKILQGLRMRKQPNITKKINPEQARRYGEIYDKMKATNISYPVIIERHNDPEYAHRFQSFLPSCDTPRNSDDTWTDEEAFRLYFPLPPTPDTDIKVASANLRLYKRPLQGRCPCETSRTTLHPSTTTDRPPRRHHRRRTLNTPEPDPAGDDVQVLVYRYLKPIKRRRRTRPKRSMVELITTVWTKKDYEGWLVVDIKRAAQKWYDTPNKNFGMAVEVVQGGQTKHDPIKVFDGYNCSSLPANIEPPPPYPIMTGENDTEILDYNQTYPFLNVFTMAIPRPRDQQRAKRAATSRCVREELHVSFSNNDRIIQPREFVTGYCKGTCSPFVSGSRNRGIDRRLMGQMHCCGPTRLDPLQVLHLDDTGRLTISVLNEFIISECGCR